MFNKTQRDAIEATNSRVLISAGAGAGKTSVMVEKVVALLDKGIPAKNICMLTFTRDSSAAMREKILERAFDKSVGDIHISTIHSLSGTICRESGTSLGIAPDYNIADTVWEDLAFVESMKKATSLIASSATKEEKKLFGAFKRAVKAKDFPDIKELYDHLMSVEDPFSVISGIINNADTVWTNEIVSFCLKVLDVFLDPSVLAGYRADINCPVPLLDIIDHDIQIMKDLKQKLSGLGAADLSKISRAINEAVESAKQDSVRNRKSYSPAQQDIVQKVSEIHSYLRNKPTATGSRKYMYLRWMLDVLSKKNSGANIKIENQLKGLLLILEKVHEIYSIKKREENVLSFYDLEQYAVLLLKSGLYEPPFEYVFVDECQDLSGVQNAFIEYLGKNPNTKVFMVGDIKQSIYRFRSAEPLQFLEKRNSYSEDESAAKRKIYFQYNYRATDNLIESVNSVFADATDADLTEFKYEAGDVMICGNGKKGSQTEVILSELNENMKDPLEAQVAEAADKIFDLLKEGYQYKDIVILLRAGQTAGPSIANLLNKMHIPCIYSGKQTFWDLPEINKSMDFLRCVASSEAEDIALMSVLKTWFDFSDQDLGVLGLYKTKNNESVESALISLGQSSDPLSARCKSAYDYIVSLRILAKVGKASQVVWHILKGDGQFMAVQTAMPGGEIRKKNLYALYEKACECEKNMDIYKLNDFVEYISHVKNSSAPDKPVRLSENENIVRIQTIHASKGLEYPICFIMDTNRTFKKRMNVSAGAMLNISSSAEKPSLGLYMPYTNMSRHIRRDSYGLEAFKVRHLMDTLAEETRLLYVAMTRAAERLYIFGALSEKDIESADWTSKNRRLRILNTTRMLDVIMPTVLAKVGMPALDSSSSDATWKLSLCSARKAVIPYSPQSLSLKSTKNDVDFDALWDIGEISSLPAKTGVTAMCSEAGCEIRPFEMDEDPDCPDFLKNGELSAAEKGSIVHKFMRLLMPVMPINGEGVKGFLHSELARFESQGFFDNTDVATIREFMDGIALFFTSPIGKIILSSENVRKEQELVFPVEKDGTQILVQGIIDAMFLKENGTWVLIDYKTDHNTGDAELLERHNKQLALYAEGVEQLTEKPVSEAYIVSLRNGKLVAVPV